MGKILLRYCIIIISLTGLIGCEGFLSFNPILENIDDGDIIGDDGDDNNDNGNDVSDGNDGGDGNDDSNDLTVETSIDDPQQTGSCDSAGRSLMVDILEVIEIPDSLLKTLIFPNLCHQYDHREIKEVAFLGQQHTT